MLLVAIFTLGYLAIAFEHSLKLNKSATALLTGVLCWTVFILKSDDVHLVNERLVAHLGDLSQILFFLLGAMTIVELIDAHDGFHLITSRVTTTSRRRLLVIIALLAFFLSAVLDNLTASIVMMTLVRKLTPDSNDRMHYGGVVILAANAGGVWTPIGDITTTMLWMGAQITTKNTITHLFLPALVSVVVPILWIGRRLKGNIDRPGTRRRRLTSSDADAVAGVMQREAQNSISNEAALAMPGLSQVTPITLPSEAAAVGKSLSELDLRAKTGASVLTITRDGESMSASPLDPLRSGDVLGVVGPSDVIMRAIEFLMTGESPKPSSAFERRLVLIAGLSVLLFVPVFKTLTHLPPVMGILLGLGVLWTITETIHKKKNDEGRSALSVAGALQRVDAPSVLFFLGILLAISALQSDGLLGDLSRWLDHTIGNVSLITMAIGLSSSVVDNVPLVAAAQGMYPLSTFPTDHHFWLFLAYCAGTGGSILIIGSAAGIAVMGIQRISFGWYLRRFSLPALAGYVAGALTYLAMTRI